MNESGKKLRIAVDAMGGDHAPGEIVKGVVQAAAELPVEIILAGPEESVNAALAETHVGTAGVRVVDAPQLIEEGDEPAFAVVRKPNCGVVVAAKLVKRGEADAMISAGPTGAAMVAGLMSLGTLGGIERPMAGGPFVGLAPKTVVMDQDLAKMIAVVPYARGRTQSKALKDAKKKISAAAKARKEKAKT